MPRHQRETAESNTYRFFVDPGVISGGRVRLDDPELAHQIVGVLRLGPGDRVVLLDSTGRQLLVVLEQVTRRGPITGAVEREEPAAGAEPRVELTLFLPLIRPERFEWALQKGTELGVAAFVPTLCARSVSEGGPAARRLERWRKIVREAAEQARRGRLPRLDEPLSFAEACARASSGAALVLWEGAGARGLRSLLRQQTEGRTPKAFLETKPPSRPRIEGPIEIADPTGALAEQENSDTAADTPSSLVLPRWSIMSGPEGGLTPDERRDAAAHGIMEASLGPRTLRAETAPIVAAAAILYEFGELE